MSLGALKTYKNMKDKVKVYKNESDSSLCYLELYEVFGRTVGDEIKGGDKLGTVSSLKRTRAIVKKYKDKYDRIEVYNSWYDGHYNESGDPVGDTVLKQVLYVYDKKGDLVSNDRLV